MVLVYDTTQKEMLATILFDDERLADYHRKYLHSPVCLLCMHVCILCANAYLYVLTCTINFFMRAIHLKLCNAYILRVCVMFMACVWYINLPVFATFMNLLHLNRILLLK